MLNIKKIISNDNTLSLAGNISLALWGLLSVFILARTLPPFEWGIWTLFITAGNMVEMFRSGLTSTALIRFLSGAEGEERNKLIGSNWLIGLNLTVFLSIIILTANLLFKDHFKESGWGLFFTWYPLLALLNLPFNNAITVLQADQKFGKILFIRSVSNGGFVLFLIVNYFLLKLGLYPILYFYLGINIFTSLLTIVLRWDGLKYLRKATKETNKKLINFGKFTMGTLLGSDLLRSSDTFIISLSPILGPVGVAYFSIPMKLTQLLDVPLRSFLATAFPKMSKASIKGDIAEVSRIFYQYTGALIYMFFVFAIIAFIFSDFFVLFLGGKKYIAAVPVYQIFILYGLLLPLDRFTGVVLDSVNRPKLNFYKVIFMAVANIIGDCIAVFVVPIFYPGVTMIEQLMMVAGATILMTIIGMIIGFSYVKQEIPIQFSHIFTKGMEFYRQLIKSTDFSSILKR
jgi:O-antigen/teichoic acid export membrane protein